MRQKTLTLPNTLLSEPIKPKLMSCLRDKDKKLYKIQKERYEIAQKSNNKRNVHPSLHKFNLKEAKKLIDGEFFSDDEEDFYANIPIAAQKGQNLGRAMYAANTAEYQNELNLENFDDAIRL